MVTMENSEEILQILERFTQLKQKEIPKELEDYLQYVAKTGDTIFKWSSLKYLFREKLLSVIKHFNEDSQRLEEIPNYPNVDPFNYETMKSSLLERLDLFNAAPFTVQRLCELLIDPRKQYSRIDKFMRALEKNILVVSTIDPGRKRTESENGDSLDSVGNGDLSLEVNIDIEMENENIFNNVEERNGSNEENTSGSLKVSCPRTDDAAVQPKAKKAKLDYDENEQSEEANAEDVDEDAVENKPEADQAEAEAEADVDADPVDAVDAAKDASEQKTKRSETARDAPEIEEPDDEEEPVAKKTLNGDKDSKDTGDTADDIPADAEPEQEDSETAKVESGTANDVKETVVDSSAKDRLAGADDQVTAGKQPKKVDKHQLESDKKKDEPAKDAETEKKSDKVVIAADDDKKDPKDEEPKSETAENKEKLASPVVAAASSEKATEPKAADAKAAADKEKAVKTIAAAAAKAGAKTETQVEPKATNAESNTEKTEPKAEADVVEPAASGATPAADEKELTKTAADAAVSVKTDDAAADAAADTAADADADADVDPAAATAAAAAVAPAKPGQAVLVPIETDETVAKPHSPLAAESTVAPTVDAATNFAANATPTLTLNDQPMEDTPVDEEDARVSPSTGVEEVVMAESGAAAGAGDMATDEGAKDEPAAMEVDDTSQEVMDQ